MLQGGFYAKGNAPVLDVLLDLARWGVAHSWALMTWLLLIPFRVMVAYLARRRGLVPALLEPWCWLCFDLVGKIFITIINHYFVIGSYLSFQWLP